MDGDSVNPNGSRDPDLIPEQCTQDGHVFGCQGAAGGTHEKPVSFVTRSTYTVIDVPVIDGIATLPDGRTVASTAQLVRVPVFVTETEPCIEPLGGSPESLAL